MEYIRNAIDFLIEKETAVTFGKFDGLHRGHKCLIQHITKKQKLGMQAVVFTFDTAPSAFLKKNQPGVLTTNEEKISIFHELGVDYVVEYPVTNEMMRMEPEEFLRKIVTQLNIKYIVIGKDFHFGYQRKGSYKTILANSDILGYEVTILEKKQYKSRDISSTYVREEVANGDLEKANMLLGHPFFVQGPVLHGNKIGRTLSMPTANLIPPHHKVLPPFGVYVSKIYIGDEIFTGITNIGRKPTIEGENPVGVETHIFDFQQEIYGSIIKISFLTYLRGERKFETLDQLKKQMQADLKLAKEYIVHTAWCDDERYNRNNILHNCYKKS